MLCHLQIARFTIRKIYKIEFLKNKPVVLTIGCDKAYRVVDKKMVFIVKSPNMKPKSKKSVLGSSRIQEGAWATDSLGKICMR